MPAPFFSFQPSRDYQDALGRAAAQWGIEPGYWDIWGTWHTTSAEVQKAILESMGVPSGSQEELDGALEGRLRLEWNRLISPVHVLSENAHPPQIPIHIPADLDQAAYTVELCLEGGKSERREGSLAELATSGVCELRSQSFLRKQLPLDRLPLGYHDLAVSVHAGQKQRLHGSTRLIICPDRAYLPESLASGGRRAGLNVSLYGLRSRRSWGCGDFTDLESLAHWVASDVGGAFIVLNPLHAIHNRQPFNTSPYLPNCVFYRNPIYLDIERIEDFHNSAWASALHRGARVQAEIDALNSAEYVEYEKVHRLKRSFLKLLFRTFLTREYRPNSARGRQFRQFVEAEGELLDRFAVYSALDEWIHRRFPTVWTWPEWPEQYRDPASEATRRFAREHWRSVLFHKYVQWQIDIQLGRAQQSARRNGLSIGLFHDLALATDSCGSDLWAHRSFFVPGCRVGAPPDDFSPKGQDWSFPPPHSEQHWQDGYRLFRESIRKSCRHGGALRIDHVMRFFRLFWIPPGKEASEGTYVRDRHEDLIRILALESVREKVLIVGEDLGTVEPSVRETLAHFGILSYRLFYFEKNDQGNFRLPDEYPRQALVSSTTHDLPTLAGFWLGRDIEARRHAGVLPDEATYQRQFEERQREKQKMLDLLFRLDLLPSWLPRSAHDLPELTGELHNAVIGFLASTPSLLLALNQEDLTKETEQQNLPGTTSQYPNWRRKMRFTVEELESSDAVRDFVLMFRHWLEKTSRVDR